MTGWDVYGGRSSVPPGMLAELAALRAALPGYDVILTSHSPARRFEVIRRDPGPGTWCLISTDPGDLWRELAGRALPAGPDGGEPDQALLLAARTIGFSPASCISPRDDAKARPTAPVHNHTPGDVASFFTGLDLSPGIADARAWMPGWRTPAPFTQRAGQVLAGVGRTPAPGQAARP